MQLNERIHKIVRRLLSEELGINSQVSKSCDEIINIISNISPNELRDIPPTKNINWPSKAANIDYQFVNGVTIRINVTIFEFTDENEFNNFKLSNPQDYAKLMSGSSRQIAPSSKPIITLKWVEIGGNVINSVYETLQHELEHTFQRIMKGGNLVKDLDKYGKNNNVLGVDSNKYVRMVSRINYLGYKSEQDAFANGLYAVLRHSKCNATNIDAVIRNTNFYKDLSKMKRAVEILTELQGNAEVEAVIKEKFGYGLDVAIKRGQQVVSAFLYRLGRVKTLYLNNIQ